MGGFGLPSGHQPPTTVKTATPGTTSSFACRVARGRGQRDRRRSGGVLMRWIAGFGTLVLLIDVVEQSPLEQSPITFEELPTTGDHSLRMPIPQLVNKSREDHTFCRRGHKSGDGDYCCFAFCGECAERACKVKLRPVPPCCPSEITRTCEHSCDVNCKAPASQSAIAPDCPQDAALDDGVLPDPSDGRLGNRRAAVIFSGSQRGFVAYNTWLGHLRHVHEVLLDDGFEVDTFLCFQADPSQERANVLQIPSVVFEWLNVKQVINDDFNFYEQRLASCYDAVRKAEEPSSSTAEPRYYDWFIRTRPDNVWFGDMPRVVTLSPLAISLRARSFANYGVTRRMNDNHMSYGWGNEGNCTAPQCLTCTAEVTKDQKCLIVDDQFAVVPRIRADHYFRREHSQPRGAPDWPETDVSAFVAKRWLDERMLGWTPCCDKTAPPRSGQVNVYGWYESKLTRALLSTESILPGPLHGDPPLDLIALPLRLNGYLKKRDENKGGCHHMPCNPPNPKICQFGRGPADHAPPAIIRPAASSLAPPPEESRVIAPSSLELPPAILPPAASSLTPPPEESRVLPPPPVPPAIAPPTATLLIPPREESRVVSSGGPEGGTFDLSAALESEEKIFQHFRALQERVPDDPSRGLLFQLSKWGLFMGMNALAKAVLWTMATNTTLCLISPGPKYWPYHPSKDFETSHGCTSYECYFSFNVSLFPPGCRRLQASGAKVLSNDFDLRGFITNGNDFPPIHGTRGTMEYLQHHYRVHSNILRSMVTRWLFAPSIHTLNHIDARQRMLKLPSRYVSVQIRWGDKVNMEAKKISASEYVTAARQLATDDSAKRSIFLATSSPTALSEVRQVLRTEETMYSINSSHVPDEKAAGHSNFWISSAITPDANFFEVFSDIWAVTHGEGAVVTYSSNIGRWVWWYRLFEINRGLFQITSLDGGSPRPGVQ